MLEMFLYGIGVMYTPGPVNIMGLYLGLNKQFSKSFGFFLGVGVAMFILFLIYGYTGEKLIKKEYLIYISLLGSIYILYLAYKVFKSKINIKEKEIKALSFKDGFLMQFFNPKATLATLPIATINFTANNIVGMKILFMSFVLSLVVIGAPSSYSILGQFFSKKIDNENFFKLINIAMSLMLVYVATTIFIDHVYYVIIGKNPY